MPVAGGKVAVLDLLTNLFRLRLFHPFRPSSGHSERQTVGISHLLYIIAVMLNNQIRYVFDK